MELTKVPLTDFFTIYPAKQNDRITFTEADINDVDAISFLSRSSKMNGINGFVLGNEELLNDGKIISIALDGSTGATFYQYHPFFSGQNIWLLKENSEKIEVIDPKIALYLVTSIRKAVAAYTYNLSLTKKRLEKINLLLPIKEDGKLNTDYIYSEMNQIKHIELLDEILDERYQV